MVIALTREPSASLAAGERTFRAREPIDVGLAARQHEEYRRALAECGARVTTLPALDDLPDAVFIEDVALVLDEVALLFRMGVGSRREEPSRTASEISRWRDVVPLPEGAHAEGGDVVRLGRTLYVGRTGRTDDRGIAALGAVATPLGYRVVPVEVTGCLHLKSACTALDDETLLANPAWVDASRFEIRRTIEVGPGEPGAANAVRVGSSVLVQAGCPRTLERVIDAGYDARAVDVGELAKAEGSLTCLSLLFEESGGGDAG
ncbi:MAG TPA: dimethylargininase [Gemmatimonadota bacterium]|nr:dimethylargininase [Gemmatimonadota bacterium]